MRLLLRWLASALALLAVAYLVPAVEVSGFVGALVAALALGLVNAVLGTVLRLLTKPLSCLTLGLFSLVLNAFLFWLTAAFVEGFAVSGALGALLGSLGYGLLAGAIAGLLGGR